MPGGLIKPSCSVAEKEIYLNCNPEITFLKKQYKKYTKFSSELKEIKFNNSQKYNSTLSFNVGNEGDLLYRTFIEVNIPVLNFTDSVINNSTYTTSKTNKLSNIQSRIDLWNSKYVNMKNFSSIEIYYYNELMKISKSSNVTITILKAKINELESSIISETVKEANYFTKLIDSTTGLSVDLLKSADYSTWKDVDDSSISDLFSSFSATEDSNYKTNRDIYKLLIDSNVLSKIDIVTYISSLTTENITDIKASLEKKYKTINKYLNYYYSNLNYHKDKYSKEENVKIKYAWSEKLGHYYFSNYEIEFNGYKVDSYDSDQLNLFQSYNVDKNGIENYEEMIGHQASLYNFSNDDRYEKKLYIPLVFWFCRDSFNALPLVASRDSMPKLNLKFNDIKNLLFFKDWEKEYESLLILDVPFESHEKNSNGSVKLFEDLHYDSVEIVYPEYIYRYKCNTINKKFLKLKFIDTDVTSILEFYGTHNDLEFTISKNEYLYMMNNIKNDKLLSEKVKIELAGYQYFINYEYLYDNIEPPKIKLFGEFIFLTDIEKKKFCDSKLEYLVELFNKDEFEINDTEFFTHELDKDILIKNMFWFCRPKNIKNGLFDYSKKYNNVFNNSNYYNFKIINNFKIIFNNYNLLKQNKINNFYDILKPYTFLKNKILDGVNFVNLSLYPSIYQPSGSFNLSKIKNKVFRISLNDDFLVDYFDSVYNPGSLNPNNANIEFKVMMTNYNVLIFNNSEARLIFYHK